MNAIILAGGKNSRIGTRKALLEIDGKQILARIIETLKPLFAEIILVTNEPEVYQSFGLPMVQDEICGEGPLGGIHAGLGASQATYSFVVACDMPFLDRRIVEYVQDQVRSLNGATPACIVPRWEKGIEPLHAFYHRDLRTLIPAEVAQGQRKLGYLVRKWGTTFVDLDQWAAENGVDLLKAFSNVNTWAEFEQAQNNSGKK
ncbi:MAG: molybdenum cofactor guanylyltransferase [Firmicutes bacterium]|nr:molybdenum cofactor guanylyltransferase [Bacillota bacterium]